MGCLKVSAELWPQGSRVSALGLQALLLESGVLAFRFMIQGSAFIVLGSLRHSPRDTVSEAPAPAASLRGTWQSV